MKKSNDRVNALRERRKAGGLIRVEVWIKPEHRERLRRLEDDLKKLSTLPLGG